MVHFALCDDEPAARDFLTRLIRQWAQRRGVAVSISADPSAEAFWFRYTEDKSIDILMLDIEMGGMNGVALAKKIRAQNREMQIIFVTGYSLYIADGYDVEALHYLIKPVTEEKLFGVLDRAMLKLAQNERALLLETGGETLRVPLYEIRYLDVQRNYVTVHAKEDITVKTPLSVLEKETDEAFFRAGRSLIVNLTYIRKVTKTDIQLTDGTLLPLPRGMYEKINRAMIERL